MSVYQVASIVYSVSLIWQRTNCILKAHSKRHSPSFEILSKSCVNTRVHKSHSWVWYANCPAWSNPDSEAKNLNLGFRVQGFRIDNKAFFFRFKNYQQCKKYSIVYGWCLEELLLNLRPAGQHHCSHIEQVWFFQSYVFRLMIRFCPRDKFTSDLQDSLKTKDIDVASDWAWEVGAVGGATVQVAQLAKETGPENFCCSVSGQRCFVGHCWTQWSKHIRTITTKIKR